MGIIDYLLGNRVIYLLKKNKVGKICEMGSKTIPDLIDALSSEDYIIKKNALEALGILKAKEAVKYIIPLLDDETVLWDAIVALERIGSPAAIPYLEKKMNHRDPNIRERVKNACLNIDKATFSHRRLSELIEKQKQQDKLSVSQEKHESDNYLDIEFDFDNTSEKDITTSSTSIESHTSANTPESDSFSEKSILHKMGSVINTKKLVSKKKKYSYLRELFLGNTAVNNLKRSISIKKELVPGELDAIRSGGREPIHIFFDTDHGQKRHVISALEYLKEEAILLNMIVEQGNFDDIVRNKADIVVISTPTRVFNENEIDIILNFVEDGGGLLLMGAWGGEKSADALNSISSVFGIEFNSDLVVRYQKTDGGFLPRYSMQLEWIIDHEIFEGVHGLSIMRSCSITPGRGLVLAYEGKYSFSDTNFNLKADATEIRGLIPVIVAHNYGHGKVLCLGDYHMMTAIDTNHRNFIRNVFEWLGEV